MIMNRLYENQNLLSLQLVSFLVGLRTYHHPGISNIQMKIVGNNYDHFSAQLLTAWLTNWSPCFLQIFGYLLKLCRISWVLEEDFLHLKREAKNRPGLLRSSQYHRLQLYRHEMTHFVHALQNYVTSIVLEASWVEFLQNLKNANTLDDLYRMHVVYIKMVLFRWVSFVLPYILESNPHQFLPIT